MIDPGDLDKLRLARTEGVGPVAYRRLLRRYRSPTAAVAALPELAHAGGRSAAPQTPSRASAERECDQLAALGGRFLFADTPEYPELLALLEDAPPVLAVLGDPQVLHPRAVALVGGRNASVNGQRIAEDLAEALAHAGLAVVSGLARGVDAAAHTGALTAGPENGRTVAVVAGGLDVPYPPEHVDLQRRIAQCGAVLAELPLGTAPQARHFPRRNRIIAGLALGVVVVEAASRSGSLITARLAQDAGREVFAVPGSPLDPRCRGSNDLIRQGAHLTETIADVLDNLPELPGRGPLDRALPAARGDGFREPPDWSEPAEPASALHKARELVIEMLGPSPTSVDDLVRRCQFSAPAILTVLLELELAGRVETLPGNRVALIAAPGLPTAI